MKRIRIKGKTNKLFLVAIVLLVSLLSISVGFSSMSTALTVNGNAAFVPVGMIRVMSISQGSLNNADELSKSITHNSIRNLLDFNSINSTASYDVVIKNLGQIDYELERIDEIVFSNNQVEYVLSGFQVGDIIRAGQTKTINITFKYKDGIQTELDPRVNSELKFIFEEYEDPSTFREVFAHEGACTFNGPNQNITGENCPEYLDTGYIDTGVALYSEENWNKDYEIGFTIESYNYAIQTQQAVFVNSKYENESIGYPGIVFRAKTNSKDLEITETLKKVKVSGNIVNPTFPLQVRIFRINGVVSYSLNGGPLTVLQNTANLYQTFNTTVWFGATPDVNGVPIRNLAGTMSHMYLKLGQYQAKNYTVSFNANGGTVSETSRQVLENNQVGTLPVPTRNGHNFDGWYTDTNYITAVTATTIVDRDVVYYAKWTNDNVAEMNGNYYLTLAEAISNLPTDSTPVTIHLVNDATGSNLTIPAGRNVTFDFGEYTLSNGNSSSPVVENYGTLSIISGNYRSSGTSAVIDNLSTGTLTISNATITATGTKQALYNNGGTCEISNTTLSSKSSIRATVHNLNNGTLTIRSAIITADNSDAVKCESGTMVIGTKDGNIDTTNLIIRGNSNGINSSVAYSLYDGKIMGIRNAVNDVNKITDKEDNYIIKTGQDVVNGLTYKSLYLGTQ